MTDKQIIIDGINIEHCAFYRADGMCNREMLLNQPFDTCERGRKTCYYMQLKRKEQECERLKHDNGYEVGALEKTIDNLKAENDNLKSLIWWIHVGAEGADKATTEYYENRNTPYEENYWKRIRALQPPTYESKYKLALTEIKEIAEKIDDSGGCDYGDYDCDNCSSLEQETVCTYKVKKIILQKISECEGNDE